jgi:sigma-B regulation protein RsbU (phosphoserine phosphatase)
MIFLKALSEMLKFTSKISRSLLYTLFATVITAAALFLFIEFSGKYIWKKSTRELAEEKLAGEVTRIQRGLLSVEQIPKNLSYVLEFSKITKDNLWILLNSVVKNNEEVYGACVAYEPNAFAKDTIYYAPYLFTKGGEVIASNPCDTTYNYFSMDWYLIPKTLSKAVWIEPYFDEGVKGSELLATYALPFCYFDGRKENLKGVVSVDISLEWLTKTVSSIKYSEGSYSMLVSENGTIICAPNSQWPYNESLYSLADNFNMPALRTIGRDLKNGKSGFIKAGKFDTKKNWWICYKTIPANNWGVLLVIPDK